MRRLSSTLSNAIASIGLVSCPLACFAQPSLETVDARLHAVNADGRVAVGQVIYQDGPQDRWGAIRWTRAEGVQRLWATPEISSSATAITWNGAQIVGWFRETIAGQPGFRQLAFSWQEDSGRALFEDAPGGIDNGSAAAVSANGETLVGSGWDTDRNTMCTWASSGAVHVFGNMPDGATTGALACSYDARVIVGAAFLGTNSRAIRWTIGSGLEYMFAPNGSSSQATACSASGEVIVGSERVGTLGNRAWRWTRATGKQYLNPNETIPSAASAISADGRVIVGARGYNYPSIKAAFIWDEVNGMRDLREVASSLLGRDVGRMHTANVSADGRTIIGPYGDDYYTRVSYVLRLRAPCAGDVDNGDMGGGRDGQVGPEDLTAFLVWMSESDLRADLDDGSGTGRPDASITIDDLLYFLRGYVDGCG